MDWFYDNFAKYYDIEERIPSKDGTRIESRRKVRVYLTDPVLWILLMFSALISLVTLLGTLFVLEWSDLHWSFGSVTILIVLNIAFFFPWFIFFACSTIVRTDKLLNRQLLGSGRLFMDTRVFILWGVTEQVYYPRNQQTVFSGDDFGDPEEKEFILTSYVKQDADYMDGFGVDVLSNTSEGTLDPNEDFVKRDTETDANGILLSRINPETGNRDPYDEEAVARLLQHIVLKVQFKLPTLTLPKLLNEQFLSAFRKYDSSKDAIQNDVRKQILEIVIGNADGILQKYSMTVLNGDIERVNRALTARITPLLRRLPVEIEAIIVDQTNDMPNDVGFQTQNKRTQQAALKSRADQSVAGSDQAARETQAKANQKAVKAEQTARGKNADNEAEALKKVAEANKQAAIADIQKLLIQMDSMKDRSSQLMLAKLHEMPVEMITDMVKSVVESLRPDLQNATIVQGIGDLSKIFLGPQILSAILLWLERNGIKITMPTPPPTP